jgi:transcriptional regulator with XRE-family HTH domain
MEVLDELNGALREEQQRHGLTKARIAERLGIHRSEVTKLLNGQRRNMTMESIAALAWALDRDIDFRLIGDDGAEAGRVRDDRNDQTTPCA